MKNIRQNKMLITVVCLIVLAFGTSLTVLAQMPTPQVNEARELLPAQITEREMTGSETHRYKFNLQANEFFQVRVEQKGVDVALNLCDANDTTLAEMDSPNSKEGFEILSFIAPARGIYTLKIIGFDEKADRGSYSIQRQPSRTSTAQDKKRVETEHLFLEATKLRDVAGQSETVIKKFQEALTGWRELNETYLIQLTSEQIEQIKKSPQASDFRTLPLNQTIESEINDDAVHYYILPGLTQNQQVLRVDVEEKGVDLRLRLLTGIDKNDVKLAADSNFGEGFGRETITFVAESSVYCVLAVRSVQRVTSQKAAYELKVTSTTSPSGTDKSTVAALNLMREANQFDNGEIKTMETAELKFKQALEIWQKLGDKKLVGYTFNRLGLLNLKKNKYKSAMLYFQNAGRNFSDINSDWDKINVNNNISQLAAATGDLPFALYILKDILPSAEKFGDIQLLSSINNNIGRVYLDGGEPANALPYLQKSLDQARTVNYRDVEQSTLLNIGGAYLLLKKLSEAEQTTKQAIQLATETGNIRVLSIAKHNLSQVYGLQGNSASAEKLLYEALFSERMAGDKLAEAKTLGLLATYPKNSQPDLAIFYAKMSVNLLQDVRGSFENVNNETRKEFLRSVEESYRLLTDTLLAQNRIAEAYQILNRLRDEQAFDLETETIKKPFPIYLTPEELNLFHRYEQQIQQVEPLRKQLQEIQQIVETRDPTQQETERLLQIEAQTNKKIEEFTGFLNKAKIEFKNLVPPNEIIKSTPETVEMQGILRDLKSQTGQESVAIYTFIAPDNFRAIIVSADRIAAISEPVSGNELSKKSYQLWALLQSNRYDPRPLSKEIYEMVFKPLQKFLPSGTTTIMWSLDGTLNFIPMAALFDGNKFLVERFNNVIFTRADHDRLTHKVSGRWTGTGFGSSKAQTVDLLNDGNKVIFSALPGVIRELESIFKHNNRQLTGVIDGEVFSDVRFTETSFFRALEKHRPLVHISSHFVFRPGDEYGSFLLLGDGEALTLQSIKQHQALFNGVELLTLSACNTAARQSGNGREIDTFAELAQRLGASAVMATLWSVSDASTPWLMQDFYQTRESQTGMTKAEALRRAQIALLQGTAQTKPLPDVEMGGANNKPQIVIITKNSRRDDNQARSNLVYLDEAEAPLYKKDDKKPFAHPYFWSPFVLFGNWK